MIYKIIADSIYCFHFSSMCFVHLFPFIPFALEYNDKKYKEYKKYVIYPSLGVITTGILFSYYFNNDTCIISKYENLFNPDKYSIYKVTNDYKLSLYLSLFSISGQYIVNNIKEKAVLSFSYYSWLLYNYFFKK